MFRRALLSLDRSAFSETAIERVVDVQPESVLVLSVLESTADIFARMGPVIDVPPDVARWLTLSERTEVSQQLDSAAARLRACGIGAVSTLIREGKPGPEIVATAVAQDCDLIIMSTHGRSGIARALLGSVANYVVNHVASRAVLLVRPDADTK